MKKVLIKMIRIYQKIPGDFHNHCNFIPTCSNYAIEAITIHGACKGSYLAVKRILKCNPFHKGGIDLVPRRKEK
ncbi:MAG: membrane protein insertion efficiency factor YidD [Bacilli bacterium]|nr:membrane protein insertion efficiency factor YidD [Bacilli bacterium]